MTFLEVALVSAVGAAVALLGLLVSWTLRRARAQVAESEARMSELLEAVEAAPIELRQVLGDGRRQVIAIEVLNPMELAAGQSRMARNFGGLAPNRIRGEVTKRMVRQLHEGFEAQGVKAEVRVYDCD